MKLFHISDVLSVTTGRLVSSRHMDGIYDILNFLTGDELFTHQLPRAMDECKLWLKSQFPKLFPDDPFMEGLLIALDIVIGKTAKTNLAAACVEWVELVRTGVGLPEMLPVYEMGADMHTRIDPVEELRAMVGDEKVIVVEAADSANAGNPKP